MESSETSIALRSSGCHHCGAEASVRLGKELLCGSCAMQDYRSDLEPPDVLCDVCQRDSTLRLDHRFLCGRCALALLNPERVESELPQGFASALTSAVLGHLESADTWAWELGKRTRDGSVNVVEASAAHHRALEGFMRAVVAKDAPVTTERLFEAAASLFGTYASSLDAYLRDRTDETSEWTSRLGELTRSIDDLRRERDELLHRLDRAEKGRAALVRHLTAAKEEERGRIAEEIHDDALQTLVALQMRLQALGGRWGDSASEALTDLSLATVESVGRLRTLVFELRSDLFDQYGLAGVLREFLARTEREYGIACRLEDRLDAEPPREVGINLYRIGQEAITNVRKHARASRADVRLEERDSGVLLIVADDGSGFDVDTEPPPDHGGLRFMRVRAERAGGQVEIVRSPGTGCEVRCWLPVSIGATR